MKTKSLYYLPVLALTLASCADSYESTLKVDKPQSVVEAEQLAALGALNSYVDRAQQPNFIFGLNVGAADYAAKGLTYSIAKTNFDCVTEVNAFAYSSIYKDGAFALSPITDMIIEGAPSIIAGPLLAYNAVPKAHLENVISPNFIKGDLAQGSITVADFDTEAIGTEYAMSNGSVATVVADPAGNEGNVLQVGSPDSKAKNSYPTIKVSLPDGLTLAGCKTVTFDIYCVDNNSAKKNLVMIVNGNRKNFTGDTPDKRGCPVGQWARKLITLDFSQVGGLTDEDLAATEFTLALGPNVVNTYYYIDNVTIAWQTGEPDKYVEKTEAEKVDALTADFGVWANTLMAAVAPSITDYVVVADPMSDMDTYMLRTAANEIECGNDTTGCFFFNDFMGDDYLKVVTDSLASAYTKAGGNATPAFYVQETGLLGNAAKTQRLLDQITAWENAGAKISGIAVDLHLSYSADAAVQEANRQDVTALFTALAASGKIIRLVNVTMDNTNADYYAYVMQQYLSIPASQQGGVIFKSTSDLWKNNARTDVYNAIVNSL